MNFWENLDRKIKIGLIATGLIVLLLTITCFNKQKPLFIKVPTKIEANKNGKTIIKGKTLPNTNVKIGLGILGDKVKSDNKGNFKLKYTLYKGSNETLKITAENNKNKKVAKVTIIPQKRLKQAKNISKVSSSKSNSSSSQKSLDTNNTAVSSMASKYTNAYVVHFKDYDIIYLINEHSKTIAYTTSNDHSMSTTNYTGNFNDGIDFKIDDLAMHAHYRYVNTPSALIISDESGNENKAYQNDPEEVVKYYDLTK